MKTDLDEWIEFTRAWVDEQMAAQREQDEAAFARFMAVLGLNNETRGRQ